ncbi:MAG: hypothetical protein KAW89_03960, partial [Armatimonadetes bacterium]|nr:hypothetical protein [Armatimonadota bacterium]
RGGRADEGGGLENRCAVNAAPGVRIPPPPPDPRLSRTGPGLTPVATLATLTAISFQVPP